jgi:hypothetical protein
MSCAAGLLTAALISLSPSASRADPSSAPALQALLQKFDACIIERYQKNEIAKAPPPRDQGVVCLAGNPCPLAFREKERARLDAQAARGDSTDFETNLRRVVLADCFQCAQHAQWHTKHVHCTVQAGGNSGLQGPKFESCKAGVDASRALAQFGEEIKRGLGQLGHEVAKAASGCAFGCAADRKCDPQCSPEDNGRRDVIARNMRFASFPKPEACDTPDQNLTPTDGPFQHAAATDWSEKIGPDHKLWWLYYGPRAPEEVFDWVPGPRPKVGAPVGRNMGSNEGRLRPELRLAARSADPLGCSLRLAAAEFAPGGNIKLAQAFADLGVTGRRAFERFRQARPGAKYCQSLPPKTPAGCPQPRPVPAKDLEAGCLQALDRAYAVANYLRVGEALSRQAKVTERLRLGWIAVSGEDDQPQRPVDAPSSDAPQFDLDVDVPTPLAIANNQRVEPAFRSDAKRIRVHTRYTIAQSQAPAHKIAWPAPRFTLLPDLKPSIAPGSAVLLFIHGMDSRAEEADDIRSELFRQLKDRSKRNLAVISVDLPSSGYADNLNHERVSPLEAAGRPVDFPIPDFRFSGKTPLLDFIEDFIVDFVETLDRQVPFRGQIAAVMGGSLGGNMSFRLGRREGAPWPKSTSFIVWSPASIWTSLGEGADVAKHLGPRTAFEWATVHGPNDWEDLQPAHYKYAPGKTCDGGLCMRQAFFAGWDKPTIPFIVPAQSEQWQSDYYRCKRSGLAGARLDRHETYDARFLRWHNRLAMEQLLFSHQTIDPRTGLPRYQANRARMLLACGTLDNFNFTGICGATQSTARYMTRTPGQAIFLNQTGHSVDNERRNFFATEIIKFLGLK